MLRGDLPEHGQNNSALKPVETSRWPSKLDVKQICSKVQHTDGVVGIFNVLEVGGAR